VTYHIQVSQKFNWKIVLMAIELITNPNKEWMIKN
jgi:hypothetical protein